MTKVLESKVLVEQLSFTTKKFALQALLDRAASVVPSRDIMPVLKNFHIVAKDGKVTVAATDMDLAVITTTEMVTVTMDGQAVFPAKRLMEIVREAGDGELLLEAKDGTANIRVGHTEWSLKLQSGEEYPLLPDISTVEFHLLDRHALLDSLNAVRFAAAQDIARQNLMMIDVSNGRMRAADGVRFQQVDLVDPAQFPLDLQIPIGAVDDLMKVLRSSETKQIKVGEDDNDNLIFCVAEQTFMVRKLTVDFPDVDAVLLKPALTNDLELHVDRAELAAAIRQVRVTADPETSAVILKLTDGKLLVTSKDKVGSWAKAELTVGWKSGEFQVAVNHGHLLDMLNMMSSPSCHFFLGKGQKTRPAPLLLKDGTSRGVLNQLHSAWLS